MSDSRGAKEEIRQRLSILDVISEYVTIKRAGKNLKGLCPFHTEKTPSFTVNEDYQSWHCFGCGEHGDVFTFIMKVENLTFSETLERLAKRAGVELDKVRGEPVSKKESLSKINSLASAYFITLLGRTGPASEYMKNRGIAQETALMFGVGYALPDWDDLLQHLEKKRVNIKEAIEAGLIVKNDKTGKLYDKFRGRIIFPIYDIQNRIAGFGGRAIGDEMPKYMNSPETPLFNKSKMLYGLNLARKKISEEGFVIMVEGYMDVITAHQAGFTNCVASMGTALTSDHISLLSRYAKKVVLAYDSDSAGIKAAFRSAAMFNEAECDVRLVRMPKGEDPDSMIRSGHIAEFAAAISNSMPLVDYQLASLVDKYDASLPAGRTAILKEAARIIADIDLFIERERYIKELVTYHPNLDIGNTKAQAQIRSDVESIIKRKHRPVVADVSRKKPATVPSALLTAENTVIKALAGNSEFSSEILNSIDPDDFVRDESRSVARIIYAKFAENKPVTLTGITDEADESSAKYISELMIRDDGPPITQRVLMDCLDNIKKSKNKLKTSEVLAPYIKQGNIKIDEDDREKTLREFNKYLRESGKLPNADGSKGV